MASSEFEEALKNTNEIEITVTGRNRGAESRTQCGSFKKVKGFTCCP
jgi:hypothetical protein